MTPEGQTAGTPASRAGSRHWPLWLPLVVVMALLTGGSILLCGWVAANNDVRSRERVFSDRIDSLANGEARELLARLQAADTIVLQLTTINVDADDGSLRTRVLATGMFSGIAFGDWPQSDATGPAQGILGELTSRLSASELLSLSSGQSVLKGFMQQGRRVGVYLVHAVPVDGRSALAFFELSQTWLWQGVSATPTHVFTTVIDASGRVLSAPTTLAQNVLDRFTRSSAALADDTRAVPDAWRDDGQVWRSVTVRLELNSTHLSSEPWSVVVFGVPSALTVPLQPITPAMLGVLLVLAISAAALAALYLHRRWDPVLTRLHAALAALRAGELRAVELGSSTDLPRSVAVAFNRALEGLSRRTHAQTCLADIDRQLLETGELEQAIEPVLERIRALLQARVAAAVLLDIDAPGYARIFLTGTAGESTVSRISLDTEAVASLEAAPKCFELAAAGPDHGILLSALPDHQNRRFYGWSVIVGETLAAVVVAGFSDAPSQEALGYGEQCAERLRAALSKAMRGERLYRQAHYDSLTGLPNRVLFRDRLSQEIASSVQTGVRGALLYVDLDHFKKVNDTVGHIAGDQLLTTVAQRLRGCVKEGDTVARLGGDEFAVILRHLPSAESAREISERIIESLQRPVNIGGRDHRVRASVGITLFPDDSGSLDELIRNADLAMYQAKDGGRARAVFFDSRMTRAQTPAAQSGLFRALRRREFTLHYQPQYALHTGELVGLEALLRWPSPRDGMRLPAEFVPAAEQSGLIVEIGAWVLESACHQLALWREEGIAPRRLALNLSVQQLRAADFARLVRQVLERLELPPQMLELEITESVFAEEEARAGLRNLAELGVRLALDDFGTGYSSLNYLRAHPVDAIKIDRSFMHEVPGNAQAATLATTIIDMAHALGKEVIAEGVESVQQLDFLRGRGCDIAQGYVLGRPVSVAEITEILGARRVASPLLDRAG